MLNFLFFLFIGVISAINPQANNFIKNQCIKDCLKTGTPTISPTETPTIYPTVSPTISPTIYPTKEGRRKLNLNI